MRTIFHIIVLLQLVPLYGAGIDISTWSEHTIISHIVTQLGKPINEAILFEDPDFFTKPLLIPNRLLLYGPPGNGKTTVAHEIAIAARCAFVHINAPSIVTKYAGSGAENIKKELEKAFDKIVENGRPVVVFVDEIDAIAIVGSCESRVEDNKAMQELWLNFDKFKQDPRVFFICATNRYEKLSSAFVSRFPEQQRLKLDKPDKEMRVKVLTTLLEKYELGMEQNVFNDLVYYSHGMSIREIESFISSIKIIAAFQESLTSEQLIKKMKSYPRGRKDDDDSESNKRDIYDKINMVSSLVTMASALTTIINFFL